MEQDEKLTKVHVSFADGRGETLWAWKIAKDLYAIRNFPFVAYGLNFNDVVRATRSKASPREVREVLRRSGHRTLRVFFEEAVPHEAQGPLLQRLQALGAMVERGTTQVVVVDIPPRASYSAVFDYLMQGERDELLSFESCEERLPGRFDNADGNLAA